jgi:hypothetical protein
MSISAEANSAADATVWHAMAVDDVVKRLATSSELRPRPRRLRVRPRRL